MMPARPLASAGPAPLEELDAATLARCRAGDPVAYRAFVVRYQAAVFALLSRIVGRSALLEDLAQDTFLKAHAALPGFDPARPGKLSTWLLTIATRVALDELKRRRLPSTTLEHAALVSSEQSPERAVAQRRLGLAIERAADALSDEQRAVLVLFQFHDFSVDEAALALGCAPATVKTRWFRARQRLRELLEREHSEESLP
jgi:RNA polymerase sigma-70 factor (ECF subfamily)